MFTKLLVAAGTVGAGLIALHLGGVLMALASPFVPGPLRASGLGIVATANGVARLLASVAFGALWSWRSMAFALTLFTVGLACAAIVSARLLARVEERA